MRYSIGDVAEEMNLPTSTLRYYDRKGLLPFVDRDSAGRRSFKDNDLNFLQVIECMKKCGMTITEIRHFIDLCMQGDVTLMGRYELLEKDKGEKLTSSKRYVFPKMNSGGISEQIEAVLLKKLNTFKQDLLH